MEPIAVVALLNDLSSRFDEALDKYGLNKVKTIGDCYMITSIPGTKEQVAAFAAVCHFALDLIEELEKYNREHPQRPLNIRIGINCGSVVAGVVGKKRHLGTRRQYGKPNGKYGSTWKNSSVASGD